MSARNVELSIGLHGKGKLVVDGADWTSSLGPEVVMHTGTNALPRLTVEIVTHHLTYTGPATVTLGERTQEILVALGWTPPGICAHCGGPLVADQIEVRKLREAESSHLLGPVHCGACGRTP